MTSKLEIRHKQRQDEIINAARRCFRRCGFHAASMSQIASEASLAWVRYIVTSPTKTPLLKRWFAVSSTFVLPKWTLTRVPILPRKSLPCVNSKCEDDDALMLEVAAEATRNSAGYGNA